MISEVLRCSSFGFMSLPGEYSYKPCRSTTIVHASMLPRAHWLSSCRGAPLLLPATHISFCQFHPLSTLESFVLILVVTSLHIPELDVLPLSLSSCQSRASWDSCVVFHVRPGLSGSKCRLRLCRRHCDLSVFHALPQTAIFLTYISVAKAPTKIVLRKTKFRLIMAL